MSDEEDMDYLQCECPDDDLDEEEKDIMSGELKPPTL